MNRLRQQMASTRYRRRWLSPDTAITSDRTSRHTITCYLTTNDQRGLCLRMRPQNCSCRPRSRPSAPRGSSPGPKPEPPSRPGGRHAALHSIDDRASTSPRLPGSQPLPLPASRSPGRCTPRPAHKEIIARGGEKIAPAEVDAVQANPKIQDAMSFGVADAMYGEEINAAVILRPGQTATEEGLKQYCRARLPGPAARVRGAEAVLLHDQPSPYRQGGRRPSPARRRPVAYRASAASAETCRWPAGRRLGRGTAHRELPSIRGS